MDMNLLKPLLLIFETKMILSADDSCKPYDYTQ
jgi:hypothetical protein